MANEFTIEPATGGDSGIWGPKELEQNRMTLGAITTKLYDDGGALKMTVGKIGLDNDSKKGSVWYKSIVTISLAGISTSTWAKIELSVSGTSTSITALDIAGETDANVIPTAFKNSYDPEKGGYYISTTKRCIGVVYVDALDALANIINVNSVQEGFYGNGGNTLRIGNVYSPAVPIGSIIAWHKTLTDVPELPENWVECDGSVVADSESPLNGQTIPDLNGDGRFLRGGNTSGDLQDHAFMKHWHDTKFDNTAQPYAIAATEPAGTGASILGVKRQAGTDANVLTARGAMTDGVTGAPKTDTETRPINMSVVWIIRIK